MSGPEWTPEPFDRDVEGQLLSVPQGADGSFHQPPSPPIFGPNPFGPNRVDRDDADAEAEANLLEDEEEAAHPGKLAGMLRSFRSALARPGSRRPEADPSDDPKPDPDDEPEEDLDPKPSRRWAPSAWTWETRVGLAAVLSFLILVGVFVRGKWVKLAMPADGGEAAAKAPEDPKPGDPPKASLAGSKPPLGKPIEPSKPSPPLPDQATGSTPHLASAPTSPEPRTAPETPSSDKGVLLLTDARPSNDPSTPPAGTDLTQATPSDPSKPPDLPTSTTDAPPLPADTPPVADGGLPTMPVSTVAADPASLLPPGAGAEPPAAPVAQTPQPEPPANEPATPQPVVVEATPPPSASPLQPTDPPAPQAESKPVLAAAPEPANPPSGLEAVPAPVAGSSASAMGPGWVAIPSAGKRPGVTSSGDPGIADASTGVEALASTSPRVADGPSIRDDTSSSCTRGEPVLHTVGPDENFWTISKDYYNSHRYYKALHKANARQVPDIAKLYVGTVIRIPPPESLDRSLVDPPTLGAAIDGAAVSRVSSPKAVDTGVELPPTRSARPGLRRARSEPAEEPRRPLYKVKPNDTLRSIARDTLSDSKRAAEIFELNQELLGNPKAPLTPGASLTLPEDAVIGRRVR